MQVIKSSKSAFFDVDSTLLSWEPIDEKHANAIAIKSPINGELVYLKAHVNHVKQLKAHKLRNHTVFVWSAGGSEWAEQAVIALGLQDFVDYVVSKPDWCYDDKNAEEYMPKSNWLPDEMEKQK